LHDSNNPSTPEERNVAYKGWVPNVAGRLSFSVFGYTSVPTKAIVANASDGDERFIVCHQKRTLIDGTLPLKATTARLLFGLNGTFWFICVGTAGDNPACTTASLAGELFLFHKRDLWDKEAEPNVRRLQEFLRDYETNGSALPLAEYCALEYSNLLYKLRETASFFCTYSLDRDGEVLLEPPPIDSLPEHSPKFPTDPNQRRQMLQSVLSQMYFFLRDIGHIHQHH
jgi:hypothetical protein